MSGRGPESVMAKPPPTGGCAGDPECLITWLYEIDIIPHATRDNPLPVLGNNLGWFEAGDWAARVMNKPPPIGTPGDPPDLVFTSAEGRQMSFELFFDTYEEGGVAGMKSSGATGFFKSVSGLKMESEVEEYGEGGYDPSMRKLPAPARWPHILLKRDFAGRLCQPWPRCAVAPIKP
jgi:hypothetical protein